MDLTHVLEEIQRVEWWQNRVWNAGIIEDMKPVEIRVEQTQLEAWIGCCFQKGSCQSSQCVEPDIVDPGPRPCLQEISRLAEQSPSKGKNLRIIQLQNCGGLTLQSWSVCEILSSP